MTQPLIASDASHALCASDRLQLFAHGEELLSSPSRNHLADCLGSLRAWLDLSEIVVATGTIETLPDACVIGYGYDAQWMELYLREQFVLVDPIVHALVSGQRFLSRSRAIAENVSGVAPAGPQPPTLKRFLEAAQDHGRLGNGFASGVVFNGRIALCSVVTASGRADRRAPLALRALRPMLYQALMRVLLPESGFPNLSQREAAILQYLASGYGDTQIADAMSISASTVRFHLGNVFEKLGARNRCHAVAIGFQSGLLQG